MKRLRKIILWIVLFLGVLILVLYITNTDYLIKAVRTIYANGHTTAFLEDYKAFENQPIKNGIPQPWPHHKNYNTTKITERLKALHKTYESVAYVIIKNDSIWFEDYYDTFNEYSKTNSFSMAKSYVSALLGKAIMDGKIKGLNQKVSDFFPQFSTGKASELTVGDLSSMASGTNWDEAYYSPFSITTRAYFDDNLKAVILNLKVIDQPGKAFKYASGDTQLLAMVIERATNTKLYDYLSEKLWKPLGSEKSALWQIDSKANNMVKAYCCIASNAKDFARLGKLYKDHGKWNGFQLLDSTFVARSLTSRFSENPEYGYGWWLLQNYKGKDFFMMRGHLGQYVIVQPEDNVIIVRLGHLSAEESKTDPFSEDIYAYIDEAYKMMKQ